MRAIRETRRLRAMSPATDAWSWPMSPDTSRSYGQPEDRSESARYAATWTEYKLNTRRHR